MPTTAELLAALPADTTPDPSAAEDLERIFAQLSNRPVPQGMFRRACSVGGLSTKLASAYMAYWLRTWYQPKEKSEQDLLETNLRSALNTLETMGYMRGAVAKLGQLLPSFPEKVPKEFVDTLSSLHFQAPPMHYSLIREQLFNELGDPEEVFAEFDEDAIAAASIGQVHRARLKTGEEVAVKIQYPGIARTIRSDLATLTAAMRPFLFNENWRSLKAQFMELRKGLESETDYEQEADNLREMQKWFGGDEFIVVPRVHPQFSTNRVLTMDWIEGKPIDDFLNGNPSQEDRDHFGTLISKAICRLYMGRTLYNDVHPGNFLFMPNRKLGFIDFGNLRRFNNEEWQFHERVIAARESGDVEEKRRICIESAMITEKEMAKHPEVVELIMDWVDHYNEPVVFEGAFDYGDPAYVQRGAKLLDRAGKVNWIRQMSQNVFSHRLQFQLPAILYRLKSRVHVPNVVREEQEEYERRK